jgi:hypothetical protein
MKRTTCLVLASLLLTTAACTDDSDGSDDAGDVGDNDPGTPDDPGQPADPTPPGEPADPGQPQPAPRPASVEDYDDLAQGVATLVVTGSGGGEVASLTDSVSLALGVKPFGFDIGADGRIGGSRFGVDYRYSLACVDGAGNSLEVCGELTDRADIDVAWSGELDTPNFDASVNREGAWTVASIQSGTAAFNGTSRFNLNSRFTGLFRPVTRTYHLTYVARYRDILVDTDTKTFLGGRADYAIQAQRTVQGPGTDVEAEFAAQAVVTFERDRIVIVLDGQYTYYADIRTGNVTRA